MPNIMYGVSQILLYYILFMYQLFFNINGGLCKKKCILFIDSVKTVCQSIFRHVIGQFSL